MNDVDEYIITKVHVKSLSKDSINSTHNDDVDNQYDINNSEMMDIREIKQIEKWKTKR